MRAGLATGIDLICKAILGEYKGSGKTVAEQQRGNAKASSLLFFVIFVIVLIVISRVMRRLGGYGYSSVEAVLYFSRWAVAAAVVRPVAVDSVVLAVEAAVLAGGAGSSW